MSTGRTMRLSRLLRQTGRVFQVIPGSCRVFHAIPGRLMLQSCRKTNIHTSSISGVRSLSTSSVWRMEHLDTEKVLLEECSLKVPSFGGSLWVNSAFNVAVQPVGTMDYPHLDRAFVKVYGTSKAQKGVCKMDYKQEGHKLSLSGIIDEAHELAEASTLITGEIEVPIVHNVNVNVGGKSTIQCRDMVESNYTHLTSDQGDIEVHKLKTANLIVQSEEGDVLCNGAIQGSVSILTGNGNVVNNKRFVGPTLDITTDSGDIRVASCYSDQSKFSTNTGNLYLRNVHNESYVAVYEQGNVTMLGLDGSTNVFVKLGDVDMQISKINHESRIHVEDGDISLKISDTFPLKISVNANEIVLDTKFSEYGTLSRTQDDNYQHYYGGIETEKFSPIIEVIAENGRVVIETQDWAASLACKLPGGVKIPADLIKLKIN